MSTDREKLEHLLNGGKLKAGTAGYKHLDELGNLKWVDSIQSGIINLNDSEIYHEQKWYENIPEQGVLCWISDFDENSKSIMHIITRYDKNRDHSNFISKSQTQWRYATPVTADEIEKCILENQK